jgi:hypothetical protein
MSLDSRLAKTVAWFAFIGKFSGGAMSGQATMFAADGSVASFVTRGVAVRLMGGVFRAKLYGDLLPHLDTVDLSSQRFILVASLDRLIQRLNAMSDQPTNERPPRNKQRGVAFSSQVMCHSAVLPSTKSKNCRAQMSSSSFWPPCGFAYSGFLLARRRPALRPSSRPALWPSWYPSS